MPDRLLGAGDQDETRPERGSGADRRLETSFFRCQAKQSGTTCILYNRVPSNRSRRSSRRAAVAVLSSSHGATTCASNAAKASEGVQSLSSLVATAFATACADKTAGTTSRDAAWGSCCDAA